MLFCFLTKNLSHNFVSLKYVTDETSVIFDCLFPFNTFGLQLVLLLFKNNFYCSLDSESCLKTNCNISICFSLCFSLKLIMFGCHL